MSENEQVRWTHRNGKSLILKGIVIDDTATRAASITDKVKIEGTKNGITWDILQVTDDRAPVSLLKVANRLFEKTAEPFFISIDAHFNTARNHDQELAGIKIIYEGLLGYFGGRPNVPCEALCVHSMFAAPTSKDPRVKMFSDLMRLHPADYTFYNEAGQHTNFANWINDRAKRYCSKHKIKLP